MRLITIIFLVCCVYSGQAQEKGDNTWLFGYDDDFEFDSLDIYGGTVLDFLNSPPDVYSAVLPMDFDATNASISNDEGDLLFYTNSVEVVNGNHDIIENGSGLSPNGTFGAEAMILPQGALILPFPEQEGKYLIFHSGIVIIQLPDDNDFACRPLYYSVVDMNANSGEGLVLEKNIVIATDDLTAGKITAVRHGNGRDWWIIMPLFNSASLRRFLLTPQGVEDRGYAMVSDTLLNGLGQAAFSPDGSKYALLNLIRPNEEYLNLFDFDRCTGEFSNQTLISYTGSDLSGGVAFSPNSRFLYATIYDEIYQYDMQAADVAASVDTVAIYDGYQEEIPGFDSLFLPTRFFMAQLAPNGKIYINTTNAVRSLHVINQPDSLGAACDVQQHALQLMTLNQFSLPSFPSYRLGVLEDSPCDSITVSNTKERTYQVQAWLFPNPSAGYLQAQIEGIPMNQPLSLGLYNQLGQEVFLKKWRHNWHTPEFNLSGVPSGVYFYSLSSAGNIVKSGKLIVQQ